MIVAEQFAHARFLKFGFGLNLQRLARHDPTDAFGDCSQQLAGRDDGQHAFAAARRCAANDGFELRQCTALELITNLAELVLVLTEHAFLSNDQQTMRICRRLSLPAARRNDEAVAECCGVAARFGSGHCVTIDKTKEE